LFLLTWRESLSSEVGREEKEEGEGRMDGQAGIQGNK
jgi:hypothetical protein